MPTMPEQTLSGSETLQSIFLRAMNTDIEILLACERENTPDLERFAQTWFQYVEKHFSRFRPDSELTHLNTLSGERSLISASMLEVLLLAENYQQMTEGIFNPLILEALDQAGYDTTFEKIQSSKSPCVPSNPNGLVGFGGSFALNLDLGTRSLQLPPGTVIDLGGIVKSWAVKHLVAEYQNKFKIVRGFVNAGGDLSVWGSALDTGEPWLIGIENPWQPSEDIRTLALTNGSVATSSTLGRQWSTPLGPMHHLIDPRTMTPSTSDVVQCTVTGPNVTECEIWAKVLCILGQKKGLELFARKSCGYEAIVFTNQKETHFWKKNITQQKVS